MCLLHWWTFILGSLLLWWPRWSVNRTYRSAGKCVRTNTASITVTESKCRRKWCGGEDQSCRLALKNGWGNLAMPVVSGMFGPQLQRAFPKEWHLADSEYKPHWAVISQFAKSLSQNAVTSYNKAGKNLLE